MLLSCILGEKLDGSEGGTVGCDEVLYAFHETVSATRTRESISLGNATLSFSSHDFEGL